MSLTAIPLCSVTAGELSRRHTTFSFKKQKMAYSKGFKKGGSGGKLGHSNMSHWDKTEAIKLHAKKARRLEEETIIQEELELDSSGLTRKKAKKPSKKQTKRISKNYMSQQQADEVIQILSKKKRLFYYFKDYYAFLLLDYVIGDGISIGDLSKTRFSRLLSKPVIKKTISKSGNGIFTKDQLFSNIPTAQECYLLTLGEWGEENNRWSSLFSQTSRPGKNLVLQLNFSNEHNKQYHRLIKPKGNHPFEYGRHPIAQKGYHTLAWSRIDISNDYEYALIEEIQNDWIRLATSDKTTIEVVVQDDEGNEQVIQQSLRGNTAGRNSLQIYIDKVLKPHMRIWDEAMLASTIWLLKEEIGVSKIYYHTYESGNELKGIQSGQQPPRSIYSKLPEKFCFTETDDIPPFLQDRSDIFEKEGHNHIRLYLLDFKIQT